MKRLALFLAAACMAFGVGTVTQTGPTQLATTGVYVVTLSVTADASTGSVPATAINRASSAIANTDGLYILQVETVPGSPNPTASWSATITDAGGRDLMAGSCATRSASAAQVCYPATVSAALNGSYTLNVTGNSVNSAAIAITVYLATTNAAGLVTATISGTVGVTQSTSPWVVGGTAAVGATASGNPVQDGCIFNTSPATITNGQAGALQCDNAQDLLVKVNTALPAGTNVIGHAIIDSGSTTAVTQATGTNLHAVTDSGSTTAVTQTTSPWTVAGGTASGSAVANPPLTIGSKNTSGNVVDIGACTPGNGCFNVGTNVGQLEIVARGPRQVGNAWSGTGFDWPVPLGLSDGTKPRNWISASLANYNPASTTTAVNLVGAGVSEKGSRWTEISNPAAGSQATASIAAESAVRHVADCISFSAGSTTAPALTALTVNLRDGATGAGTVIWTKQVIVPNSTGQNVTPFAFCGLNLVGTTNTAMTLEFSASLANLIEEVSLSGFNVN